MKHIIRKIGISIGTIYLLTFINQGFYYTDGYKSLLLAGFVMFFLDTIVEPILGIIFLPINFLTRGLFNWVIGIGLLFALLYFVPSLHISEWTFPGYTLDIPKVYALHIPNYTFSFWPNLILVSFLFNFISGTLHWILED